MAKQRKQTTIHDIANRLSITASTVSRALGNHPRISEKTKTLVKDTAHKMNYKPNIMASNLRTGKAHTIGLIVPHIHRHFFSTIINGIEKILNPAGYQIFISQSNESLKKEIENVKSMISHRVDGMLISTVAQSDKIEHLKFITESGIPLIQFDRIRKEIPSLHVSNNDFEAAYKTTEHLIKQGYKNIVHIAGPLHHSSFKNRVNGYSSALNANNANVNPLNIIENITTQKEAYDLALKKLQNQNRPDAFFAYNDWIALGVMQACEHLKLSVPNDIGICGYANEPFSSLIQTPLSSVEQHSETVGEEAAKLLLALIENNNQNLKSLCINPTLLIRKSSTKTNLS